MTMFFARIARDPRLYVAWFLIVILALVGTYFANPYIFGFTTLGLFWLSVGVTLVGLIARGPSRAARLALSLSSLVATLIALGVLRTFKWA